MKNTMGILLTYERALNQVHRYEQECYNSAYNFLNHSLEIKATLMLEAGMMIAEKLSGNPIEDTKMLYAKYSELINGLGNATHF